MPEYKPNSHKYHALDNEKKESESKTETSKKKPTVKEHVNVGQRFKDTFFSKEIFSSVVDFIVNDVIVPAVKETIGYIFDSANNAFLNFVDDLFHQERDSRRRYNSYGYSRHDYRRDYQKSRKEERRTGGVHPRRNFGIENFEFESRNEAEDVLQQMNDQCRRYDGVCPVSAFYDFIDCERPNDWTHDRWGWSWAQLDRARIIRRSNGSYVLSIGEPDTYID